ncbi:MAG: hypothetical protein WDN06_07465 [Asticcacaulis sp.]
MQKINAANWISAARSCSPAAAPCSHSLVAALSRTPHQRPDRQIAERIALSLTGLPKRRKPPHPQCEGDDHGAK